MFIFENSNIPLCMPADPHLNNFLLKFSTNKTF